MVFGKNIKKERENLYLPVKGKSLAIERKKQTKDRNIRTEEILITFYVILEQIRF